MRSTITHVLATICVFCGAIQATNADIIGNFYVLDFDTPGLPGNGQFNGAAITVDTSALYTKSTGAIVFNLTGLNITGDATANDSASFTINVSAAGGGNIADTGSAGSQIGITGNSASGLSDPSELLTFSFGSGSVLLGDPGTGAAVNFIGFHNLALNGFGPGETLTISGGTTADGTYVGNSQAPFNSGNALGNVSSFTVNANSGDNFSVERLGARIQFLGTSAAVPEPSSLVFLAAVLPGLLIRLRKNAEPTP